jgi:hypothetical protein
MAKKEWREMFSEAQINGPASLKTVLTLTDEVVARYAALLRRVERIESKGVVYRGLFNLSDDYTRGDLVTHGGSIFHAVKDTRGIAPAHEGERGADYPWQLACRRGRDGKDYGR